MRLPLAAIAAAGLALCGCATLGEEEFACPGHPGQPMCLSASQVYAATEHADTVRPAPDVENPHAQAPAIARASRTTAPTLEHRPAPLLEAPLPVRTPAQVMRIWIAPWEDEAGDLHVPGYVFTEVESRRWTLGEPVGGAGAVLSPLQVQHRAPRLPDGPGQPGRPGTPTRQPSR